MESIAVTCIVWPSGYTSLPVYKLLPASILCLSFLGAFAPGVSAYTFSNPDVEPLYGPAFRRVPSKPASLRAPEGNDQFYGTPHVGVQRLRNERRERLLRDLQQRAINLQESRKAPGLTPNYSREHRIYERLLQRVNNVGITHYRKQQTRPAYRMMWVDGELKQVRNATPDVIENTLDAYERRRLLRTSPNDAACKHLTGSRLALCRYQQRVSERIIR